MNKKELEKRYYLCELWSKIKTIRDDKNTPITYARWCEQVMELLGWLQDD